MPDQTSRISLPEITPSQLEVFSRWNEALQQIDAVLDAYVLDVGLNTPPVTPAAGDTYIVGDAPTDAWTDHAEEIAYWAGEAGWNYYTSFLGMRAYVATSSTLVVRTSSAWIVIGSADLATTSGAQTLSNKTLAGGLKIHTSGGRVSLTSSAEPLTTPEALLHVVNKDAVSCGLRVTSYWKGTTAAPYQNNDDSLLEVYNKVESSSTNRSWAGSYANAYNDIPAGVTDSGDRTGIIGWAVSAAAPGYTHAGTLNQQLGVHGTAGFQGPGSAATARIVNATGVRGFVYNDSVGATIENARAGEFITTASVGTVEKNVAVYASAGNGTVSNFSFFGNAGTLFNSGQVLAGSQITQSSSKISARTVGNAFEFGRVDTQGFASNLGATAPAGSPFLAFCAEAEASGNTFRTRGKAGVVLTTDLSGALVFYRLSIANASSQTPVESARIDSDGHLQLAETPYLPTKTPASATATGKPGEVCWDAAYLYVCTAPNVWKRVQLSSW